MRLKDYIQFHHPEIWIEYQEDWAKDRKAYRKKWFQRKYKLRKDQGLL